jgi:hypothetical protein
LMLVISRRVSNPCSRCWRRANVRHRRAGVLTMPAPSSQSLMLEVANTGRTTFLWRVRNQGKTGIIKPCPPGLRVEPGADHCVARLPSTAVKISAAIGTKCIVRRDAPTRLHSCPLRHSLPQPTRRLRAHICGCGSPAEPGKGFARCRPNKSSTRLPKL